MDVDEPLEGVGVGRLEVVALDLVNDETSSPPCDPSESELQHRLGIMHWEVMETLLVAQSIPHWTHSSMLSQRSHVLSLSHLS